LTACERPVGYKSASELVSTTILDNCPTVINPDQADSNNDGLGDACAGGGSSDTKYTLEPPSPILYGSKALVTTTFFNDTGQNILTFLPDCIGNTTFVVKDLSGNILPRRDRVRAPYRIPADLFTINQGTSSPPLTCDLTELLSPEVVLIPGAYTVQAYYNNHIQDPDKVGDQCNAPAGELCYDLWSGVIKSTEQTFTVYNNYTFSGFFAPGTVNKAKAGQAVPVKWRITDPTGTEISDTSSFVSLTSYPIDCGSLSEIGTEVTTESAAGASGLQYMGGGNWQFNWKTQKSYANQCRVMVLKLNDGSTHTADFTFVK